MTATPGGVPLYQVIRITAPDSDDQALADAEAALARTRYPRIMSGAPLFGAARELEAGGWEILHLGDRAPQQARDSLSPVVRKLAQQAAQAGDENTRDECMRAAAIIDSEVFTDLTVLDTRYRIIRCQTFICSGPGGPEPRADHAGNGNLEARLHLLARQDLDGIHRHLPRIVARIRDRQVPVDWGLLIRDLTRWPAAHRVIATRWLQNYYRTRDQLTSAANGAQTEE